MLDEAAPLMNPELEALVRPPAPERGAEALRAYAGLRARLAGEAVFHIATGEAARVQDILRFYSCCWTSLEIEGVEALLATLGTLDEETKPLGVSATTVDRVLLAITDAEGRYLAHVLQPLVRLS
jgi:hypothetical protein